MTVPVPDALAAAIERLAPPDDIAHRPPADVTGALRDLWTWWQRLMPDREPSPAWVTGPSGTVEDAVVAGLAAADSAVDAGATILVPRVARRDDAVARALIALLTRKEASAVLAQPEGMSDADWMSQCARIRDLMSEVNQYRGEPIRLLEAVDAGSIAGVVGLLMGAAARRTPVLVDGTDELAAALVADRLGFRAKSWWRAGSTSADPGRAAAIDRIDLAAGLPLGLTDDEGRGAQATLSLLRQVFAPQ